MNIHEERCKVLAFLAKIGIQCQYQDNDVYGGFVSHINAQNEIIQYDSMTLSGDLLHEAGHIATTHPRIRPSLTGEFGIAILDAIEELKSSGLSEEDLMEYEPATDLAAIAWSVMAAIAAGVSPKVLLAHYLGDPFIPKELLEEFTSRPHLNPKNSPVLRDLVDLGMMDESGQMINWLRMD